MAPSLYRISAILLVLFALGHTLGFRRVDPSWHVDTVVQAMRSAHFDVNGFDRTYYDFFVGFGLFVTVLMLFAAGAAWQLAGLAPTTLASLYIIRWGLVACFAVTAYVAWRYFFALPMIFSAVILLVLSAAAWASAQPPLKS